MFLFFISLLILQIPSARVSSTPVEDDSAVRKISSDLFRDPNAFLFPDDNLYEEIAKDTNSGFSTRRDSGDYDDSDDYEDDDYYEDVFIARKRKWWNWNIQENHFQSKILLILIKMY